MDCTCRGLGRRIHGSVEETKLSTNKQHTLTKKTQQGKDREEVQLPDPLIETLETIIQSMLRKAKNVRTSWLTVLAVFKVLNRK